MNRKVLEDKDGVYFVIDDTIVRPFFETSLVAGQETTVKQCSGTPCYGVGKDEDCGRGVYLEAWFSTGVTPDMKESTDEKVQEEVTRKEEFYERVKSDYPITEGERFSFSEVKKKHRVLVENKDTVILRALRETKE